MVDISAVTTLVEIAMFERFKNLPFGAMAALPMSFPNVEFTPPEDEKYIAISHFPNTPINYAMGEGTVGIHQGFFQAAVHWPKGGNAGTIQPNGVAGKIVDWFKRGTKVATSEFLICMYRHPVIGAFVNESPINNRAQSFVPVTIWYRTETI